MYFKYFRKGKKSLIQDNKGVAIRVPGINRFKDNAEGI